VLHPHGGAGAEHHRGGAEEEEALPRRGVGVAAVALRFVGGSQAVGVELPIWKERWSGSEGDGGSCARAPAPLVNRPLEEYRTKLVRFFFFF